MSLSVAADMARSVDDFDRLVWPAISPLIGGGERVTVEGTTNKSLAMDLDTRAGIDAWQLVPRHGMRGIASRVQRASTSYDTFTIRFSRTTGAETEWAKRIRAIEQEERGWLFPHLTIHAFISMDGAKLLSVAAVRTLEFYRHVKACIDGVNPMHLVGRRSVRNPAERFCFLQTNSQDGNRFLVSTWEHLERCGVPLKRWPRRPA